MEIIISDDATTYTIVMEEGHDMPMGEDYAKAKDRALAVCFIQGANPTHNAEYLAHLQNSHLEGNDIYLKTLIPKACHSLHKDKVQVERRTKMAPEDARVTSSVSIVECLDIMPTNVTRH